MKKVKMKSAGLNRDDESQHGKRCQRVEMELAILRC